MKKFLTLLSISVVFPLLAFSNNKFSVKHGTIYTLDEAEVAFTVDLSDQDSSNKRVFLLMPDKEGGIKYRWEFGDNGTVGDKVQGDGIWTRRVIIKEKKPKTLEYTYAIIEKDQKRSEAFDQSRGWVSITIEQRPTFIDLLKKIWSKITS